MIDLNSLYKLKRYFALILSVGCIYLISLLFIQSEVSAEYVIRGPYYFTEPMEAQTVYNDYHWYLYPPGNISGHQVIGVDINLSDEGTDWDARVTMRDTNDTYYTGDGVIWNNCGGDCLDGPPSYCCNGFKPCFDVCTGGANQQHRYIVNGWESGDVDVERVSLNAYEDDIPGSTLSFNRLIWIYVIREWVPDGPSIVSYSAESECGTGWSGVGIEANLIVEYDINVFPGTFGLEIDGTQFICTSPFGWVTGTSCPQTGQTIDGILLNSAVQDNFGVIRWNIEFISKGGMNLPVRAIATDLNGFSTGWVAVGTWNVDLNPPDVNVDVSAGIRELDLTWQAYEPGSVSSGFRKSQTRYCTYSIQQKSEIWDADRNIRFPYYCITPIEGNVETIILPDDPIAQQETVSVSSGRHFVQMAVEDIACNLTVVDTEIDVPDDSGEPDGVVGDPWLVTAYGDTFSKSGYSNMTLHTTTYPIPKEADNSAFFSTYIISKSQQSWTSNHRSFQNPNWLLDNYADNNRTKVSNIYDYLHTLYDSNASSCLDSGVVLREVTDFSSPLDASCVDDKLYFIDNEETTVSLPAGWLGQTKSSDRACLVVSKGPLEIPEEVNSQDEIDAFFLSQGPFSSETRVSGGSGLKITSLHNWTIGPRGVSMALDQSDIPFISYYPGWIDDESHLYTIKCLTSDCSNFSDPAPLVNTGREHVLTSVSALNSSGFPVISYMEMEMATSSWRLIITECGDEQCIQKTTTDIHKVIMSRDIDMAIDAEENGDPLIVYSRRLFGDQFTLDLLRCGDSVCSSNNTSIFLRNAIYSSSGAFSVEIEIPPDNLPVIAYIDDVNYGSGARLVVIKCMTADCSSRDFQYLYGTPTNFVTESLSLAVDEQNRPIISFIDSDYNLRVIKCGNAACTAGNIATLLFSGIAGTAYAPIALGKELPELPVIAFGDLGNGLMRIIKCSTPDCSDTANNTITTIDGGVTIAGMYPSLSIPSDNNPIVAYLDITEFTLKVAKCADPACAVAAGGEGFSNNNPLIINGSVVVPTVDFGRILSDNTQNPAEIIRYDPKYLDIFNDCLGESYSFKIREYQYVTSGS